MEPFKVNHKTHFNEEYIVKFMYLKDDGFWGSKEEEVYVKVKHGVNEKNNHRAAVDLIEKQYSNFKLISCKYC